MSLYHKGTALPFIFSPLVPLLCLWCPALWSLQPPDLLLLFPFPLPVVVLNFLLVWEQHQHLQWTCCCPEASRYLHARRGAW